MRSALSVRSETIESFVVVCSVVPCSDRSLPRPMSAGSPLPPGRNPSCLAISSPDSSDDIDVDSTCLSFSLHLDGPATAFPLQASISMRLVVVKSLLGALRKVARLGGGVVAKGNKKSKDIEARNVADDPNAANPRWRGGMRREDRESREKAISPWVRECI